MSYLLTEQVHEMLSHLKNLTQRVISQIFIVDKFHLLQLRQSSEMFKSMLHDTGITAIYCYNLVFPVIPHWKLVVVIDRDTIGPCHWSSTSQDPFCCCSVYSNLLLYKFKIKMFERYFIKTYFYSFWIIFVKSCIKPTKNTPNWTAKLNI